MLKEFKMKENAYKGHSCECDAGERVKSCELPSADKLSSLAGFFKNFADVTRIRILTALDVSPLCVCELSELLSMTDSAVSHQLKGLRDSDLVRAERRGKHIIYSLADSHVRDIIEKAIEHIDE